MSAVVAIQKPGFGNLQKGAYVRVARDHHSPTATTAAEEGGATVAPSDLCTPNASYENVFYLLVIIILGALQKYIF
jgi:hypothetical protein